MFLCAIGVISQVQSVNIYSQRAADWRIGAIVYQVFVDRFVPPVDQAKKSVLYQATGPLRAWTENPKPSAYEPKIGGYPHCFEFWGGDLKGVQSKLPYIVQLGADVVYLTPIFKSPSNHKYDTEDYLNVDPQLGTNADLSSLIKGAHRSNLKVMLDGVFNHIGATSKQFVSARSDSKSPYRNWFYFGKEYPKGYRGWSGVESMPALRLEEPTLQAYLWGKKESVVQKYLADGADGWRLDVAFELGPKILQRLTASAHKAKPGSAVVGEISGYPADWFPAVDGVFNFTPLNIGISTLLGKLKGGQAGLALQQMVDDAGIENLLKSWLLIDNHDTPRFADLVTDPAARLLVQALQFTLPGAPCIYYGSELGMQGAGDPQNRAPMRWDLAVLSNPIYASARKLIQIRKSHPALRFGDFKSLATEQLLGFVRYTDRLDQTVIVLLNPTNRKVSEVFPSRVGRLMSWGEMRDVLTGKKLRTITGLVQAELEPKSVMILEPVIEKSGGYSPYDRIIGPNTPPLPPRK